MADSQESVLGRHLREAVAAAGTEARLHPENQTGGTKEYIEKAYDDIYNHAQQVFSAGDIQELRNPGSSYRYSIAMQGLEKMSARRASSSTQKNTAHTQGAVATSTIELLKNKDKYGLLDGKNEDDILEAAWFSTGTIDELSTEEIKEKTIAQKQAERRIELEKKIKDKKALEMQYNMDAAKIAALGPSEKELRDARREATITYFENQLQDNSWATRTSNSQGELYSLESTLISAASLAKGSTIGAEVQSKLTGKLGELSEKVPALGVLMRGTNGAQFFRDPSGYLASKAGGAITKLAAKQASKWAVKAALAVGLNTVAPGVGMLAEELISRVVGPLIQKAILGSFKKTKDTLKTAGAALGGLAVIVGSAIGPGLVVGATATAAISIILVPIIAFIMFIINASGYVVPPGSALTTTGTQPGSTGASAQDNPYIKVTKTANPPGPFKNSDLPFSVEYTITITAKKETLTNVTFKYDCQVLKDGGGTCPPVAPAIPTAPTDGSITTAAPFTFKYTQNYSVAFQDSLVMDNLTVTANVASDPASQKSSGFAAIIIGNPPTKCFVLDASWPDRERGIMLQAIAQIVLQTGYTNKLCSRGNVNLVYGNSHACYSNSAGTTFFRPGGCQSGEIEYGGRTTYPSISFYTLALSNFNSAFYTLSHESGHIFQGAQPSIWGIFRDTLPLPSDNNGYICTYPIKNVVDSNLATRENFAESIALYIRNGSLSSGTRDFTCLGGQTFQQKYPEYYNYMVKSVFN